LDNELVRRDVKMSPHKFYYRFNPAWIPHLHPFGEIAIVNNPKMIQSKLNNRGYLAIDVGPETEYMEDVYNICISKTRHLIQ
jgi:hypothetical protein